MYWASRLITFKQANLEVASSLSLYFAYRHQTNNEGTHLGASAVDPVDPVLQGHQSQVQGSDHNQGRFLIYEQQLLQSLPFVQTLS